MKKRLVKALVTLGTALWITVGTGPAAVWADMGNYNFVSIESGVADAITVNGVEVQALYRPYDGSNGTDSTYSCAALVHRFYSQVYGRTVSNLWSTTSVPEIDQGSFSETNAPRTGDILRDNQSVHWAIVKEVNGDTCTVIQQNAWDKSYTKAWVNATVDRNDARYSFFTWSGNAEVQNAAQPVGGNFSFEYTDQEISQTNAVIHGKVNNPDQIHVQQVGCYLWDAEGTLLKKLTEDCSRKESKFNMWYDINSEMGITLTPGSSYSYQFFVVNQGNEIAGEVQNFTTKQGKAKKTDSRRSSKQSIQDGILMLHGGLNMEKVWMYDEVGTPVRETENAYVYEISTLLEKTATTTFEFAGNDVIGVKWEYTYGNGGKKNLKYSKTLYKDIVKNGGKVLKGEAKGYCTSKDNLTTEWVGQAKVEWNLVQGVPVVSMYFYG